MSSATHSYCTVTDADRTGADPSGIELDAAVGASPASTTTVDLEDPDAMWVGGAGGGWRAPPASSAPVRRGSDSPALYNTTLMTVRAQPLSTRHSIRRWITVLVE